MVTAPAVSLIAAPADSARVIAAVYTASLMATMPLVVALAAAIALRSARAEARILVWRSAILSLLMLFVGRMLSIDAVSWTLPSAVAAPLIALGRVHVSGASLGGLQWVAAAREEGVSRSWAVILVRVVLAIYLGGVGVVLLPTVVALCRARGLASRAARRGGTALDRARALAGLRRDVRLVASRETAVPMTFGLLRPVIVLPVDAETWDGDQLHMALLHEAWHVRHADWATNLVARVTCSLFWFHPGVWWLALQLRADCETACDDRVIGSGVRRSAYAELLLRAADASRAFEPVHAAVLGLARGAGLRVRLADVLDVQHAVRPLAASWAAIAATLTIAIAGPVSIVRLEPDRAALTTLMSDARWESRAYAVVGLAARPDTIAIARRAAEGDPSPRVRAWARYALDQSETPAQRRATGER